MTTLVMSLLLLLTTLPAHLRKPLADPVYLKLDCKTVSSHLVRHQPQDQPAKPFGPRDLKRCIHSSTLS